MDTKHGFFKHHIFFCTNQRAEGEACCGNHKPLEALEHCKKLLKSLGLIGDGQVRVSKAGCLGRCDMGPAIVIYPEATWYTYFDLSDIDSIVNNHIINKQVVKHLLIDQ